VTAADGRPLLGDLQSARDAWEQVEAAYAAGGVYAEMRSRADAGGGALRCERRVRGSFDARR